MGITSGLPAACWTHPAQERPACTRAVAAWAAAIPCLLAGLAIDSASAVQSSGPGQPAQVEPAWEGNRAAPAPVMPLAELPESPSVNAHPTALANAKLASMLRQTGHPEEAEKLLRDCMASQEAQDGGPNAGLEPLYDQLISLLLAANRLLEAEELARRVATAAEANHSRHGGTAGALNRLAEILRQQNRYTQAEALYRRALAIDAVSVGQHHPTAAIHANNLALVLMQTGREPEAERCLRHALKTLEQALGPEHVLVANTLNNLGLLLRNRRRLADSETILRRALTLYESRFKPDHPSVATCLENLGSVLQESGRTREAEPLLRRALAINETSFGPAHPSVIRNLNNLSVTVLQDRRPDEALALFRQVLAASETVFGANHPNLDAPLHNLAQLLASRGNFEEADTLCRRRYAVIATYERLSGQGYPRWAQHVLQHSEILSQQGILSGIEIQERILTETRAQFGPDHLYVAGLERALGECLMANLESAEARPHFETALRICQRNPQGKVPGRLTQVGLAAAWREIGDIERARALLAQVLTDWELDPKPVWSAVGEAAFELAVCDFRSGRLIESERWIRKSLGSYRQAADLFENAERCVGQASAVYEQILQAQGRSPREIQQELAEVVRH